jgi:hypothetical protein
MINYKIQINYKIKIKHKAFGKLLFDSCNSIATRVPLKDLTLMLCFQNLISQTI